MKKDDSSFVSNSHYESKNSSKNLILNNDNNSSGFSHIDNIDTWLPTCSEENSKIFEEKYLKRNGITKVQKNKTRSTFITNLIKEEENMKEDDKKEENLYLPTKFSTLPHEDSFDDNIQNIKSKKKKKKDIKLLKMFDLIPEPIIDKKNILDNYLSDDEEFQSNNLLQYLNEIKCLHTEESKIFPEISKRTQMNQNKTAISSIIKFENNDKNDLNTVKSNTPKKKIEISTNAPIFIPKDKIPLMSNNINQTNQKMFTPNAKEMSNSNYSNSKSFL